MHPDVRPLAALLALWRLHSSSEFGSQAFAYGVVTGCLDTLNVRTEIHEVGVYIADVHDVAAEPASYGRDPELPASSAAPYFLMRLPDLSRTVDLFLPDLPAMEGSAGSPIPLISLVEDGPVRNVMAVPRENRLIMYIPGAEWEHDALQRLQGYDEGRTSPQSALLLAELVDTLRWLPERIDLNHRCWERLSQLHRATADMRLAVCLRPEPIFVARDGTGLTLAEVLRIS
jgi:hypothetical protein